MSGLSGRTFTTLYIAYTRGKGKIIVVIGGSKGNPGGNREKSPVFPLLPLGKSLTNIL